MAAVFEKLGKRVMPKIALKAFPDVMQIEKATVAAGSGGGQIKSGTTVDWADVPCSYEPISRNDRRYVVGEQLTPSEQYVMTFPVYMADETTRINFDSKIHRFRVDERNGEPEKVFRVVGLRDFSGVVFETVCVIEN